jgi:hypothetical protein
VSAYKVLLAVMPDLIRYPEVIKKTGFQLMDLPTGRQAAGMTNRKSTFIHRNYLEFTTSALFGKHCWNNRKEQK